MAYEIDPPEEGIVISETVIAIAAAAAAPAVVVVAAVAVTVTIAASELF